MLYTYQSYTYYFGDLAPWSDSTLQDTATEHPHCPSTNTDTALTHRLQEISLLDHGSSFIPHRLSQFLSRIRRLHCARQTAISNR
jgi:hypothetical protein